MRIVDTTNPSAIMKNSFLFIILLVPVILLAQPNPTIQAFKAEKLFEEGKSLYQTRQYQAAIDKFNQVVTLDPDHQQVYELRAESFYHSGNYDMAIEDYSIAIDQHPRNAELRNSRGVAAANMELYDAAAAYFYEALQIDPNHPGAKKNIEVAQRKRDEIDPYYSGTDNLNNDWISDGNSSRPGTNRPDYSRPDYTRPDYNRPDYTRPDRNNPVKKPVDITPQFPINYPKNKILVGDQADPLLVIEKIVIEKNSTFVTFSIRGTGNKNFPIQLDRKNGKNAFYITDRSFKKEYRLKNIRSLAGWPSQPYQLKPREKKIFVVEFEPVDPEIRFFHILEGKTRREGSWDFWDVELKRTTN